MHSCLLMADPPLPLTSSLLHLLFLATFIFRGLSPLPSEYAGLWPGLTILPPNSPCSYTSTSRSYSGVSYCGYLPKSNGKDAEEKQNL